VEAEKVEVNGKYKEESPDLHKCVAVKGTRIDRVLYSISGNLASMVTFALLNTRNFRVLYHQTTISPQ